MAVADASSQIKRVTGRIIPAFTCSVTTGQMIRENPAQVMAYAKSMAEAVRFYKSNKEEIINIMQKYTRGQKRSVLEGAYAAYDELLVKDMHPTIEGLQHTLEVQASFDPKAANAKAKDFVNLRFVNELKKSGFIDRLYHDSGKQKNLSGWERGAGSKGAKCKTQGAGPKPLPLALGPFPNKDGG